MFENTFRNQGYDFAMHAYAYEVFDHKPLHVLIPSVLPAFKEDHIEAIKRDHLRNIVHTIEHIDLFANNGKFSTEDKKVFKEGFESGLEKVHKETKGLLLSDLEHNEAERHLANLNEIYDKLKKVKDTITYFRSKA